MPHGNPIKNVMNILIAYATKSGTTGDCARELGKYFSSHAVTYADLSAEQPAPSEFDIIIIGSYIRNGKIAKSVSAFIKKNRADILSRRFGLYLCCGSSDRALEYFKSNFDGELWENATSAMTFGGETRLDRQKGMDKLIMKLMLHLARENNRNEDRDRDIPLPALIPENIRRFADQIKGSMKD